MPIRESQKHRYPKNWRAISDSIRFDRAEGRCECTGQCGSDHEGRCDAPHGEDIARLRRDPAVWRRCEDFSCGEYEPGWHKAIRIVLTVAHLNHTPEDCHPENLMAMCQRCHLRYDRFEHGRNAAETRKRKKRRPEGQRALPGME